MDINRKFNNAIADVVDEALARNWKQSIEAAISLAEIIKSSGHGKQVFIAIMENLEIELRQKGGERLVQAFAKAFRHRDHYLKSGVIVL